MQFEDIDKILVKKRIRQDMGDLDGLMNSLKNYGLMNPIIINKNNILLAGHRRLTAAKALGWTRIPVLRIQVAKAKEMLEWEIEENLRRKDFSPEELEDAYLELAKLSRPPWYKRLWKAIKDFFLGLFGKKKD